jgi:hypothetical protein
MSKLGVVASIVAGVALVCLFSAGAQAVPAFARKTGMPCVSCHFGGTNRLTKTGLDFLVRGHRMKDDEGIKDGGKDLNLMHYLSFASKVRFTANNAAPYNSFDVESLSIYSGGPLSGTKPGTSAYQRQVRFELGWLF